MSLLCIDADAQQALSLDGGWNFWIPTDSATAALPAYAKSPVQVTVPHTYNLMDGLENYAGRAFYNRELPLTEDMKGKICGFISTGFTTMLLSSSTESKPVNTSMQGTPLLLWILRHTSYGVGKYRYRTVRQFLLFKQSALET